MMLINAIKRNKRTHGIVPVPFHSRDNRISWNIDKSDICLGCIDGKDVGGVAGDNDGLSVWRCLRHPPKPQNREDGHNEHKYTNDRIGHNSGCAAPLRLRTTLHGRYTVHGKMITTLFSLFLLFPLEATALTR